MALLTLVILSSVPPAPVISEVGSWMLSRPKRHERPLSAASRWPDSPETQRITLQSKALGEKEKNVYKINVFNQHGNETGHQFSIWIYQELPNFSLS